MAADKANAVLPTYYGEGLHDQRSEEEKSMAVALCREVSTALGVESGGKGQVDPYYNVIACQESPYWDKIMSAAWRGDLEGLKAVFTEFSVKFGYFRTAYTAIGGTLSIACVGMDKLYEACVALNEEGYMLPHFACKADLDFYENSLLYALHDLYHDTIYAAINAIQGSRSFGSDIKERIAAVFEDRVCARMVGADKTIPDLPLPVRRRVERI